jgi:hypothetical protein
MATCAESYVTLIQKSASDALADWHKPIELWFWDTGIDYGDPRPMIKHDLLAWDKHIIVGGKAFLRDTFDKRFGSDLAYAAVKDHYALVQDQPGLMVIQKHG